MHPSLPANIPTRAPHPWRTPALLGLGALAASYFYVRARVREAENANPARGQFIEVDGVRLHYIERGSGPPLVLLHGNGIMADDFATSGLIDEAARRYHVYAFDRPGFGHSERPRGTVWTPLEQARLLHKALRQLGVQRPVVLGHSWGTMVALSLALELPDDVAGLVLLSGYYYPSMRLDAPLAAPPAIPILGDLLRYTVAPLLGRLLFPLLAKGVFSPEPVADTFRRLPVWMLLRPSQLRASAAESALMIPSAFRMRRHYGELQLPVAIIAGESDHVADPGHNAQRLAQAIPHARLHMVRGAGHMVHYTDPGRIVAIVDELRAPPKAA
jgi:pimeloyl-ACP methyl ester carboxylesterase